jgi:hypothetical protein
LKYKSPLHQTVSTTPTEFWNDSCSVPELTYAIEHGATVRTLRAFTASWHDLVNLMRDFLLPNPDLK